MYTKNHEWVEYMEGENKYRVGLTDHAQEQLGEIVYVQIPRINKPIQACSCVAIVESVKTTAEIYAPADGKVQASNPDLADSPSLLNEKPL